MYSEKLQILEEILGAFYFSNDECLFMCPYCKHHKRKLSVNISKNTFKCWVCDSRGRNIYSLVRKCGNHSQKQHWRSFEEVVEISEFDNIFEEKKIEEVTQRVNLPSEYTCLANKNLPLTAKTALKYLKKRGLNDYDILKWKIGYCENGEYRNRVIIPSFNLDGYCDYFIARTYTEDWLKYKNPPASKNVVFNELMINWNKSITLVEGVFDAINADNSVPILGSTLNTYSKLFRAILTHSKRVYVALDQDAEKKALNIINALISHGVEVCKIDTSGYEDIGEMTKEKFEKRKQTSVLLDETTLLMQKILQI
tara:strand:+ start:13439 stop:14371 length:933 start_codon:yes stop_codon:yes gene_type:complete